MRRTLVNVAIGRAPADLVIENGRLVNVNTGEIEEGVDVTIKNGRIALVGDAKRISRVLTVDAKGAYIVPSLLDAHVHVESSMLTLTNFAKAVLPHGTTGVFIDPHEIANVLGMRGVKLLLDEAKELPLKVFITIPSCVPSAPELETSGYEIGPDEVAEALEWDRVVGLGELMDFSGVLACDEKLYEKVRAAFDRRKVVEGHAPSLLDERLCAYVAAGAMSDHESTTSDEAVQRLRLGMKLEIREGSAAKNLATLVKPILRLKLDTRHCLLATDDRHPFDLLKEGHMDYVVRRAIEEGVDPVRAIQMATINVAEHFRVDVDIGSVNPGRVADVLLVDDIEKFYVKAVFVNGVLMAKEGKLLLDIPKPSYPEFVIRTMNVKDISLDDFIIRSPVDVGNVKVRVIRLVENQILTEQDVDVLKAEGWKILSNAERDVIKVAVVERHKRTGNVGLGFVRGFGIKEGAIASSVSHDAHNVIALGVDDVDIATAVRAVVQTQGGQVIVRNGAVLARVELPFAGLMSEEPVDVVSVKLEKLHKAAASLGIKVKSPFMYLSFLTLAVVPRLRITDKGLVDVERAALVPLILKGDERL